NVYTSLVVYSFLNRCLSSSGSSPNVLYNSFNVLEIFNSWRSNLFNVVVPLSRKEYKWLKLKDWGSSFTVLFSSEIDGTRDTLLIFCVIQAKGDNLSINVLKCLRFTVYKFTV